MHVSDGQVDTVYQSATTRVFRRPPAATVWKQPLGADAAARLRSERDILLRLADVPGIAHLVRNSPTQAALELEDGGESLAEVLRRGRLPIGDVLGIAATLAHTLAAIHRAGVIHRDVHPGNVLLRRVDGQARVLLVDFDRAMFASDRARSTEAVGMLGYAAPEQTGRTARPVDQRADLYALGATLYELATGRRAFAGADALALMHEQLVRVPAAPADVDAAVPAAFSAILLQLLLKEPEHRYQSAQGLVHDLERVRANHALGNDSGFTLGEHDFPERLTPPRRLVGRGAELAALHGAFETALSSTRRTLLLEGGPGVGKSALLEQLRARVQAVGGWYLYGKFDQYQGRSAAAGAVTQALRSLGRLLLALSPGELQPRRDRILASLGPNAGLITGFLPEFVTLLGVPPMAAPADPQQAEQRMMQATVDLLCAVATEQQPIVLALDDLQWAGAISLRTFDRVMSEPALRGLLLAGAYRGGEVADGHPLRVSLDRWTALRDAPLQVALQNLAPDALGELVASLLRLPRQRAGALADALGPLTGGNPFETVEMVNALRDAGLVTLEHDGWQWDAHAVRHFIGRSSVAELLATRIGRLAPPSRDLLDAMSCLGNTVDGELLAIAAGCAQERLAQNLQPAFDEGLVLRDAETPSTLHFRHDLVQQAVLVGLGDERRPQVQLAMARRLAAADRAMEAAQQYLSCSSLVDDAHERGRVVTLFAAAGDRLLGAANFELAERYLAIATEFLDAPRPAGSADTRNLVDTRRHIALCSLGRLAEADALYTRLDANCANALDLLEPACLQMRSLESRGRVMDSLELGRMLLVRLGVPVPANYEQPDAQARLASLGDWVERERNAPAKLQTSADPRVAAASMLLARMARAAFFLDDAKVFVWALLEGQRLWATHGPTPPLTAMLGRLAIVLITFHQNYRTGYEVARHVVAVGESLGFGSQTEEARHLAACFASHWFVPLEECVAQVVSARQYVEAHGDASYACYMSLVNAGMLIDCGETLDSADAEIADGLELGRRTGNTHAAMILNIFRQSVRSLRGQTHAPGHLDDDGFSEAAVLARPAPLIALTVAQSYWVLAAVFGDLDAMVRHSALALPMLDAARRQRVGSFAAYVITPSAYLLVGMMRAEQLRREPQVEREARIAHLEECRAWMAERAADHRVNHMHLALLLKAEQAWALGLPVQAMKAFDDALREVHRRARPWHRALITERAALFQLDQGWEHSGTSLLAEARDMYAAWGASGKVGCMERDHPQLRAIRRFRIDAPTIHAYETSSGLSADTVDLHGVLRASQALSSPMDMARLASKVTEVLAALTGATHVLLLLQSGQFDQSGQSQGGWELLAPDAQGTALRSLSVEQAAAQGELPLSAFRYAERTYEPLRVDDVMEDDRFSRDPYFAGRKACSLLVVPIAGQGTGRAMLVLENRVARAAFAANRLDTVMLIAGQLAVSLANVQMYERLEERVRARTDELQRVQAQLVAAARRAGMAEIANNVLHNVGNVLNSVNVATALLETRLRESKSQRLDRVVEMLEEHAADLPGYLGKDERAKHLAGYLRELASAMGEERRQQLEELATLDRSVTHIKAVVRSQQAYSGASSVVEVASLGEVIEEALRVTNASTPMPGLPVVRDFAAIPARAIDRQRLLQILVNLISNATDAMQEVPAQARQLTLSLRADQKAGVHWARIGVRDEGCGIAPEHRGGIFAHGFTTKKDGHGFGLHSSAVAAMEMGGKLHAHSDGPGRGAVFTLEIPLGAAEP